MTGLTLEVVGEVPAGLDMVPTERVFETLAASELRQPRGIINLALTDDAGIRELNRDHAGHDYATDVLSFSYIEDEGEPIEGVVGEMAVSVETAGRQAQAANEPVGVEVALLVLHGSLHIIGYDHASKTEQVVMQELQRRFMEEAGYPYREFVWED
ncbi:MAG TPA: rRNA maturation RNase YbeY [Candidatus Saccharimonas sp.]|nr:rRNA maturation RNase YbeY [Candidatus Saccharimonas sp.]